MTNTMVTTGSGEAEAWLARPRHAVGKTPGVLLFMDAIGLRPQIRQMADRIADWGYVVLAPNTFHRSGSAEATSPRGDLRSPGAREEFFTEAVPRMRALTSDLSRADTTAYLDALRSAEGVAEGPVGVIGYCMGARLALRAAGDHPDTVAAVGGFHGGGLVTEEADSPHLWLRSAKAHILLRHADQDPSMTPEQMDVLASTARSAGLSLDQEVYTGAPHGYSMTDTSMYDAKAAERHFEELREHFASHLASS